MAREEEKKQPRKLPKEDEIIVKEEEKHLIKPIEEEAPVVRPLSSFDSDRWKPKTSLGKRVKTGEIANIDTILDNNDRILEVEIVDMLLPTLESDLLLIGQSKGKFGGGQRRVFRQTQKKTKEGNKPSFATCAVVGDRRGHIGLGYGKSRETVPAREKALRNAKLNIIKIRRGCGSWQCNCKESHSIPFSVNGKCGSVIVKLMPAPKGTGLCVGSEVAKVLKLAGVGDVWSRTEGKTTSRINLMMATIEALKKLMTTKVQERYKEKLNITE
jgi:small subunit ribosomal protein S5